MRLLPRSFAVNRPPYYLRQCILLLAPFPSTTMVSSTEDSGSATKSVMFHHEQDIGDAHEDRELESSHPPRRVLGVTSSSPSESPPLLPESYKLSTILPPKSHLLSRNGPLEAGIGSEGITSRQAGRPSGEDSPNMEDRDRPSAKQSARYKWYTRLHFAAICWCFFLQGWNDGTAGPLLPSMQSVYHVRRAFSIILRPRRDWYQHDMGWSVVDVDWFRHCLSHFRVDRNCECPAILIILGKYRPH